MKTKVIELTIPLDGLDLNNLLREWQWILPETFKPIQLTKFGDWFFTDSAGQVFLLDLVEGNLVQVAESIAEYNTLKDNRDKKSEWFLDGFVFRCDKEALHLRPGECYGWRIHPVIGGKFEFENIQIFSLEVYQSLMGQLLCQWKKLKPGDPIPQIRLRQNEAAP